MNEKFYIISYDLRAPGRDYTSLYKTIKLRDWQHPLESMWLVYTHESADDLYNDIKSNMDDNDLLFISELRQGNWQGWISKVCWAWINERKNV